MEETSQQLPTAQRKSPMTNRKTLVVGAGITGGALARLLHDAKRSLQYAGEVLVWEKSNIAGGRMMARSFRKNRNVHVDIGAQYLTKFTSANDDVREMLLQHEKLSVFEDREILQDPTRALPKDVQHHTVAHHALGFRSVVEYLLTDAALQVSREVERFEVLDANHIKVTSTDGHEEVVQDLVLTCPIPNVLSILDKSAFQPAPQQLQALQRVEYSQRIAVALLFDESIAANVRALGWTSKYVTKDEDPIVRFLCWDNLKKHQAGDSFALLVHTGVPFGAQHMDNKDQNDEILATIVQRVHKLLVFLPEPKDTILHRWRMSQVTKPYSESADATAAPVPSITLSSSPRIVLAGDAFLGSVFDNCLLSAKHAASTLLETSGSPPTSGL